MTDVYRIHRGRIATPVRRYTNPDTARSVTLAGVLPFGERTYFHRLRTAITRLEDEGAVVLCEHAIRVTDDQRAAFLDATEAAAVDVLQQRRVLHTQRARELGWIDQHTGLGYPPRWRVADLTQLDLVRAVGAHRMLVHLEPTLRTAQGATPRAVHLFQLMLTISLRSRARPTTRTGSSVNAAIADYRRETVLSALRSSRAGSVVVVWVADDLPALEADLLHRGHVRTREDWYDAGRLPAIGRALRGLVLDTPPIRAHLELQRSYPRRPSPDRA